MKYYFTFLVFIVLCCISCTKQNKLLITSLTCEYKTDPLSISSLNPRLGWQLKSNLRNQKQRAYHILVSDDLKKLRSNIGNIWNSKKTNSESSFLIRYQGVPLTSGEKYYWKVKVWDQDGHESQWSEPAYWQMGLLDAGEWHDAQWIGYEELPDSLRLVPGNHGSNTDHLGNKAMKRPVTPVFRKEFDVSKRIQNATLYISGLGQYEATINGRQVGNGFLTPGWTYYDKTVFYNIYDVTKYLQRGKNAMGVIVGNGFHNINRERYFKISIAFGMPKLIARLNIRYSDGTESNTISDTSWKTSPSAVTFNSIYGGEDYDARLEQTNWDMPGFIDNGWKNAIPVKSPSGKLVAESDYPVAVMEKLTVKEVNKIKRNKYVYDFGQNASGIIEFEIKGEKGQEVRFTPGEILNQDGTVKQNNDISGAPYYFSYTLKGDGIERWRPRFSYYGFRYVQVDGCVPDSTKSNEGLPRLLNLDMLHTRNSSPEVGHFECSNELMNRIFSMTQWGIRSNFVSNLTDCPHREKLGWLEVTHLMGDAIHLNYDIYHFYTKLVYDMMDSQTPEGLVPTITPEFALMDSYFGDFRDAPVWGSASVVLPWLIYKWYGDTTIINKAWPMMNKYIGYLSERSDNFIINHGLGDWCELNPNEPGPRITPTSLMGTAQFYYDLVLMVKMAGLFNKEEEKEKLNILREKVKEAFNKEFFDKESCIYATGSQASLAVPLAVGLVEEKYHDKVFDNLIQKINKDNKVLTVGSAGIRYLVQILMENGASQLFFDMNNRYDAGYGLQYKMGATTLVEPWIPSNDHGSNNHPALGNIMRWFYEGLGGIQQEQDSKAYKNIIINPHYIEGIDEVNAHFMSPFGRIKSEWDKQDGLIDLTVEIPVNTSAIVFFPVKNTEQITENGNSLQKSKDLTIMESGDENIMVRLGSGNYSFRVKLY